MPEKYQSKGEKRYGGKNAKSGARGRLHFFGFRRPKSVVVSLLPSATMPRAAFFPQWRRFRMKHKSL
jgi:hypothetical protein